MAKKKTETKIKTNENRTVFGCFGTFWPCNYNNLRCALSIKTTALAMVGSAWKQYMFRARSLSPP